MLRVNVTIQLLVYIFIHMCSDKNLTAYIFAYITYNSLCMSRTSCCGRTVPFRIPLLLLLRCTLNISAAGVCRSMSVCLIHVFWFALRHPFLPFSAVFFFVFLSIYLLDSTTVTCMRCYLLCHVNKLISNTTIAVSTISVETTARLAVTTLYIHTRTTNTLVML